MRVLAEALHLRITQTIDCDFLDEYHKLNMTKQDAYIIDELAVEHSHELKLIG